MIITRDFLQLIEKLTIDCEMVLMVLRTVGPDMCTDVDKLNQIYSAYKTNFDIEDEEIFNTFLKNHWTFLEFETEEDAMEFARENLPMNKTDLDPDYFVQFYIFNRGALAFANDDLKSLSSRTGVTPQPVE